MQGASDLGAGAVIRFLSLPHCMSRLAARTPSVTLPCDLVALVENGLLVCQTLEVVLRL